MSGTPQFVDGTGGTALAAVNLNALAPAQSYLISGTTPGTSASLVLTVPAQVAVVNPSNAPAVAVSPSSTTLTVAASSDTYIDLSAAGTYTQVAVANGAAPPAVTANNLRLWKVVSSGTAITAVSLLAALSPKGTPATPINVPYKNTSLTLTGVTAWTQITGGAGAEQAAITTLLAGSRITVFTTFGVQNTSSNQDTEFDLQVLSSPGGSGLAVGTSLTGGVGFGLVKAGWGSQSVSGIGSLVAPIAGTYTIGLVTRQTTSGTSPLGSLLFNVAGAFATNFAGLLQLTEVA